MKINVLASVVSAGAALALGGCNIGQEIQQWWDSVDGATIGVSCDLDPFANVSNCRARGSFHRRTPTSPPNASTLSMQISASNAITSLPASVLLRLYQGSTVLATASFGLTPVNGTTVVFSDPSAVDNWMNSYSGVADGIDYETDDINVAASVGTNTITSSNVMVGSTIQSATYSTYYKQSDFITPP